MISGMITYAPDFDLDGFFLPLGISLLYLYRNAKESQWPDWVFLLIGTASSFVFAEIESHGLRIFPIYGLFVVWYMLRSRNDDGYSQGTKPACMIFCYTFLSMVFADVYFAYKRMMVVPDAKVGGFEPIDGLVAVPLFFSTMYLLTALARAHPRLNNNIQPFSWNGFLRHHLRAF